jgi:hypothetical protein
MTEPLFGQVAPIWPAAPFPGFAWVQTPMAPGSQSIGALSHPIAGPQGPSPFMGGLMPNVPTASTRPGEAYGFSSGAAPGLSGPNFGVGLTVVPTAVGATLPMFAGQENTVGVTAPALVAAIAMRRGQPVGPTNDQEIEDFIYDALDLFPGAGEVEVRCDGGRETLTGSVSQKRLKRDAGEIAWAIPGINDVQNNVTIAARRRSRASIRESEPPIVAGRKQA